jgi:hypothetical protein
LGKRHGKDKTEVLNYTIEQLVTEYHILRDVIFEIMEEDSVMELPISVIYSEFSQINGPHPGPSLAPK